MGGVVARSEQLKGARFGAHEIIRLLGHGATASVFEGCHVALGKSVAVKILHEHLADDPQIRERFLREGRVAARLRHPYIVDVLDVGAEQGVPYLVMELLRGSDLRTLLLDAHLLTLEHALFFLLPIASALAHAHDAGVLHRDLKPANIFLSRDTRDSVVPKLVDFGLSKLTALDDAPDLTATEMVAGTVLYMAPEQTLGMRRSSPASDQYSLATILYECVCGQTPFHADGMYALIEAIRRDVPKAPSLVNPRLHADFDDVILRAMHRDPAKRFPSMRAFGRALLPFAGEDTVRTLERDFLERASARAQPAHDEAKGYASSRPSIRRASAPAPDEETRLERAQEQLSERPQERLSDRAPDRGVDAFARDRGLESGTHPTLPALPCPPGESPFLVKGMPYRGLVHLATTMLPKGLDTLFDAIPDARIHAFLRQPFLATARYDILPFLPISVAFARILGVPYEDHIRATTAAQVRYDARTVYRLMFEGGTPADLPGRTSRFHSRYFNFGQFAGGVLSPDTFYVEHAGIPAYLLPWYQPMYLAYTQEAARLLGATELVLTARPPAPAGRKGAFDLLSFRSDWRWR